MESHDDRVTETQFDRMLEAGIDPGVINEAMENVVERSSAMATDRYPRLDEDVDQNFSPGTAIGAFVIDDVIDAGGMGIVYRATQESPKRAVALKVMRLGLASRSLVRRFEYESKILAHLHHPNIAQVFHAGVHFEESVRVGGQGIPYFAMEYIANARTIIDYSEARNLSTHKRVELFLQVCDAVQHGHQKGIIHRDLKPSNILVDGEGRVKVIDFGVAKATESDIAATTIVTSVGQLIGTVQYMSPEQCSGEWGEVDTRSDVYSLGVILYELLCRVPPYDVSTTSIVRATKAVCEAEVRRPNTLRRELRACIEAVILKSIARDPEKRYANAGELRSDLQRWHRGEPVEARRDSTLSRARRWLQRHPIAFTLTLCASMIGATIAGLIGGVWYIGGRPSDIRLKGEPSDRRIEIVAANGNVIRTLEYGDGYTRIALDDRGGREALAVTSVVDTVGWLPIVNIFELSRGFREITTIAAPRRPLDWPPSWLAILGDDPAADTFSPKLFHNKGFDNYPDVPGQELVVAWAHYPYFASMIGIYSARGELLYHRWHRGHVIDVAWLENHQMLVAAAARNQAWLEPPAEDGTLPDYTPSLVVMAIEPDRAAGHAGFVCWLDGEPQPGVRWYRYVAPRRTYEVMAGVEIVPRVIGTDEHTAKLSIRWPSKNDDVNPAEASIILDPFDGRVLRRAGTISFTARTGDPVVDHESHRYPAVGTFDLLPYPRGLVHYTRISEHEMILTEPQPEMP